MKAKEMGLLTQSNDAEGVLTDASAALGGVAHLLGPDELLAVGHRLRHPIRTSVEIQDET